MSTLKGDYIGFTYNNVHSSDLGIIRVSNGSRFDESLLPTVQDKTVQIPGGDGSYYFGSYYTSRQFDISFAFDGITEQQLNFMKELFGDKKIHSLIFDETPYKIYSAKVTGSSTIKYIPFAQGETNRIYKGEGTLQFICYQPFAICKNKNLADYNIEHAKEWNGAANLLDFSKQPLSFQIAGETIFIEVYNPGVKETDWELILDFKENGTIPECSVEIQSMTDYNIKIKEMLAKWNLDGRDDAVCFNSKTNLIEGLSKVIDSKGGFSYKKTGQIYNEYIQSGSFFKIPVTIEKTLKGTKKIDTQFIIKAIDAENIPDYHSLTYDYYYF